MTISKEANKILYFESNQRQLNSYDVIEGTSALMGIKELQNSDLWEVKVEQKWNSSAERALYWLTGGDDEWKQEGHYKYEWSDVCQIFTHKFSDIVYDILENAKTLGDIKDGFNEHLSIPKLYEFSLNNGLIK